MPQGTGQTERTQVETERAVIAVLLNDNHAIVPVMGALDGPEVFTDLDCRRVYGAILTGLKEDIAPNVYTVAPRSGVALDKLNDISRRWNTKISTEVLYLCEDVVRWYRERELADSLDQAKMLLEAGTTDLEAYATHVMSMIAAAADRKGQRDSSITAINERLDAEIAEAADGMIGYETGLPWLDIKTGGLQRSHVWVVAAPYKGRKTSAARNLILPALKAGAAVDWFALEGTQTGVSAALQSMLATEILKRQGEREHMILSETYLLRGMPNEIQKQALVRARQQINGFNLRIYDSKDGITNLERMATLIKRDQMLYGMQIFVVDYMQRIGQGKLYDRMETATQTLQTLIQEAGLTGVLLSQLSEAAIWASNGSSTDDNYSPGSKGGGDLPAAADFLIATHYKRSTPEKLGVELKLARHAQPGLCDYEINPACGLILAELGEE